MSLNNTSKIAVLTFQLPSWVIYDPYISFFVYNFFIFYSILTILSDFVNFNPKNIILKSDFR